MSHSALLTFSIGPVHTFIAEARRTADQWAGSRLLSKLIASAVEALIDDPGCDLVFPAVPRFPVPEGLPNRLVARVPRNRAPEIARQIEATVRSEWNHWVAEAVAILRSLDLAPADSVWTEESHGVRQTDAVLDVAWSWVPEESDRYGEAARQGARQFAGSRRFRPFPQRVELGEKCAICGRRTALPDGVRSHVRTRWRAAALAATNTPLGPYFREDQGRLCLVCATKRLYPHATNQKVRFQSFPDFAEADQPYFALVALDGDRLGEKLGASEDEIEGGDVETFHRAVSERLTAFAGSLLTLNPETGGHAADLRCEHLGLTAPLHDPPPQLVYAGGEDVVFVCHARDALPTARAIRERYRQVFADLPPPKGQSAFTLSGAVLLAHVKHPAGLSFHDLDDLLRRKAKGEAGRDALALSLDKRSGLQVETAFGWDEETATGRTCGDLVADLVDALGARRLSSGPLYRLAAESRVLTGVLSDEEWRPYVEDRLGRSGIAAPDAARLAGTIAPLLASGRPEALRIARFFGRELT